MTHDDWSFTPGETHVTTPSGQVVSLQLPIAELLPFPGVSLILFAAKLRPDPEVSQNVVAVSESGDVLWRIASHPWSWGQYPYTKMEKEPNGARLYNLNGYALVVDPLTGQVLSQEETR